MTHWTYIVFAVCAAALVAFISVVVRRIRYRAVNLLKEIREKIASHSLYGEILYQRMATPAELPATPEASAFATGRWEEISIESAGWPAGRMYKVRSMVWHEGKLYASLTGPNPDGPEGCVLCWDGQKWSLPGGEVRPTLPVEHLIAYQGNLIAAEYGGVWALSGDVWRRIDEGLPIGSDQAVYCFTEWQGKLVAGFWGKPSVAVYDGNAWTILEPPQDGWGKRARSIYCMQSFMGALYVATGTGSFLPPGASVWRYDGQDWEKVGGQGLRGSWMTQSVPFVLSMKLWGKYLLATVSRGERLPPNASNIWVFDGSTWSPVSTDRLPALMANSLIMNDAAVFAGHLIVATGDSDHRNAQIWEDSANGDWHPVAGRLLSDAAAKDPAHGGQWVYCLCVANDELYAGTAGHTGAARIFRFCAG